MDDQNPLSRPAVSRRKLLAATAGTALTATAGCSAITNAFGGGLPSCDGEQWSNPTLTAGNPASDVSVTEYVDLSCPHCATFAAEALPRIRQQYIEPGDIEYVHRAFPIPVDNWTLPAANAVRSVQEWDGNKAAFRYAELMLVEGEKQGNYSMDFIAQKANTTEADPEQVRSAVDNRYYCQLIRNERERAKERGVEETPTLYVNDRKLVNPGFDELSSAIDDALNK